MSEADPDPTAVAVVTPPSPPPSPPSSHQLPPTPPPEPRRYIANRLKYFRPELLNLMKIMEQVLPIGPDEWNEVVGQHAVLYPGRDAESIRRKYATLHRKKVSTGNPNILEEVRLAKRVKHLIGERAEFGGGEEEYDMERNTNKKHDDNDKISASDGGDLNNETINHANRDKIDTLASAAKIETVNKDSRVQLSAKKEQLALKQTIMRLEVEVKDTKKELTELKTECDIRIDNENNHKEEVLMLKEELESMSGKYKDLKIRMLQEELESISGKYKDLQKERDLSLINMNHREIKENVYHRETEYQEEIRILKEQLESQSVKYKVLQKERDLSLENANKTMNEHNEVCQRILECLPNNGKKRKVDNMLQE